MPTPPPPSTRPLVQRQRIETTQSMETCLEVQHTSTEPPCSFDENTPFYSVYEAPVAVQSQPFNELPSMGNFDGIEEPWGFGMAPGYNDSTCFDLDGIAPINGTQAPLIFDTIQQVGFSAGFSMEPVQPTYAQSTTLWSGDTAAFDQNIQAPPPFPSYQLQGFDSTQPIGSSGVSAMNHFSSEDCTSLDHIGSGHLSDSPNKAQFETSLEGLIVASNNDQPQGSRDAADYFGNGLELNHKNPMDNTQLPTNKVALQHRPSCGYCGVTFSRHSDRDRHLSAVHFKVLSYNCKYIGCSNNKGKGYCRRDKLKEHVRKHHDS